MCTLRSRRLLTFLSYSLGRFRLPTGCGRRGVSGPYAHGQGREREAGPPPADGAQVAGRRQRGLSAQRHRPHQPLRLEAQIPDARPGWAQGLAADREIAPDDTSPEVAARIKGLALAHPAHGCNRIEALLALGGRRVSAITIQQILNDKGPGTRRERWLALERRNAGAAIELSPEQVAFLGRLNPRFCERHVESERPGQLPTAGTYGGRPDLPRHHSRACACPKRRRSSTRRFVA
jgi:hypothetical protein